MKKVSLWDAMRFANWLHNGQPTGAQDGTTTENGAYTLTPTSITSNTVTRNAGANIFVPSEDEWYKAAYYDPGAMVYFDYPAGSDTQTTCTTPGATANTANCAVFGPPGDVTDVGSYTGSASPYGTFDQGGNVWEWYEDKTDVYLRGLRGGSFLYGPEGLGATAGGHHRVGGSNDTGFGIRLARPLFLTPVPSLNSLGMTGLLSLLGLVAYRKLRA